MTAYYAVWTALSKIQPNPPYGYGTGSGFGSSKFDWDEYDRKNKIGKYASSKSDFGSSYLNTSQQPSAPITVIDSPHARSLL